MLGSKQEVTRSHTDATRALTEERSCDPDHVTRWNPKSIISSSRPVCSHQVQFCFCPPELRKVAGEGKPSGMAEARDGPPASGQRLRTSPISPPDSDRNIWTGLQHSEKRLLNTSRGVTTVAMGTRCITDHDYSCHGNTLHHGA